MVQVQPDIGDVAVRRLRMLLGPQVSLARLPQRLGLLDRDGRRLRGMPPLLVTGSQRCCVAGICRGAVLIAGDLLARGDRLRLVVDLPGVEIAVAVAGAARRLGVTTRLTPDGDGERLRVDDAAVVLQHLAATDTLTAWSQRIITPAGPASDGAEHLRASNTHRSRAAATTVAAQVTVALQKLGGQVPTELAYAGRLRLRHPTASLSELAALSDPPLSKDTIAGRLRRLLGQADRHLDTP
ncbi:DNA-binding protein WhiA [Micromonosporaceae bacterium Da 78-11]